jgi:hypothetical protein
MTIDSIAAAVERGGFDPEGTSTTATRTGGDSTVERADGGFAAPPVVVETPGGQSVTAAPGGASSDTLMDIPGEHEVWKVDGVLYLVWFVPNIQPPLPIMYEITSDVEIGTVTVDKTITGAQADAAGGVVMGSARTIDRSDQHPYDTFLDTFEAQLATRPWLSDPEILSKLFGAYLEGRALTIAELQDTDWFRTHNEQQRQWLVISNTDPATANQMIIDQDILTRNAMIAAGIDEPPEGLVQLVSANLLQGNWSVDYTNDQIRRLADPFSPAVLDDELTSWLNQWDFTLDTTRQDEQNVRDMLSRWLGPAFSTGWSDDNIGAWAGEFRNNPDAPDELREALQAQRMALYPAYTNPELTYEDIAAPWRSFMFQAWGQAPDETDPFFSQIVNLNDAGKASQLLRTEGLARGNPTTTLEAIKAFSRGLGGPIVRSDPAVR